MNTLDGQADYTSELCVAIEARERGHLDEAVARFRGLIERHPNDAFLHWQLGYIFLDQDCPLEAVERFQEAARLDPQCAPAWGGLGQAHTGAAQWDLAEQAFRRRLEIQKNANHLLFLADVLNVKGEFAEALSCCRQAVALRPDFAEGHLNAGLNLRDLRRFDEAAEALGKAIELDPNDPRAYGELGFLKFGQGDVEGAESILRQGIELPVDYAYNHFYLFVVLRHKFGHWNAEAADALTQAFALASDDDLIRSEYEKAFCGDDGE
jgi:tetratricopeptide (TPR) repeat protein